MPCVSDTCPMRKRNAIAILGMLLCGCGKSQTRYESPRQVGGACEGCEAVFEFGNRKLNAIDTLPDFDKDGPKIEVTGIIYQPDGITPAKDVVLYVYHTNQDGLYLSKAHDSGWGRRHGHIRGWVRTGADGKYAFHTLRPGVYPDRSAPSHIHPTILEPDGKYYWIESFLFAGDPLLTPNDTLADSPRGGGNGLLHLRREGEIRVGKRDIILGRNIPDYH